VTARLEARGLSAGYGARTVLSGVSLALAPGRVAVLLGENGAGTLSVLNGATVTDLVGYVGEAGSGTVNVDGTAQVTITNAGKSEGDEVAQLYLSFPAVPGAPLRALRGFKRVHLKPGESQNINFELKDRDLSMVSEAGSPIIPEGVYSVSIGGGQPNTGAPVVAGTFKVTGTKTLPE